MSLVKRVSAAAASVIASGMIIAPAALADATCTISGNGSDSTNRCTITITKVGGGSGCENTCDGQPKQVNKAKVKNKVKIRQNTGGNTANRNTGGNVNIETGNNTADVTITNDVNTNN
jgi:hypothetical protein